ncbi:hypothetical protein Sste5346_007448 [Sporothrix stenoceras]|uniref:Uncharacterized protein n=1 Tax=Sporothrix stenoceras TaxID=5173 RepID=A0ABR3YTL9_9PEZI
MFSIDNDLTLKHGHMTSRQAARMVVAMAFHSGRSQSLSWPPTQPFGPENAVSVALQNNKFGSALLESVYPVGIVVFLFPALVYIFFTMTRKVIRKLSLDKKCEILHCPTTVQEDQDTFHDETFSNVEDPIGTPSSSHEAVGSRTPSPPGSPVLEAAPQPYYVNTKMRRHRRDKKPQTPLRVFGKYLLIILRYMSGTLAEGAVETLAPAVLGVILIVTTATGIVLYGIGYVGVSSLAESGVFGLTKDAIDTLLELIQMN